MDMIQDHWAGKIRNIHRTLQLDPEYHASVFHRSLGANMLKVKVLIKRKLVEWRGTYSKISFAPEGQQYNCRALKGCTRPNLPQSHTRV